MIPHMPTQYVNIPRNTYESLLSELKRMIEICGEVSDQRLLLRALRDRLEARGDKAAVEPIDKILDVCVELIGLRVEFSAIERRLREIDQELTPLRPASRTDIKAAFENAADFASGKKKPPGNEGL